MESTLQFVPGLGARKARALLMQIRAQLSARKARGSGSQYAGSDWSLTCREDLRDGLDGMGILLGERVFNNACSFLLFKPVGSDVARGFDPLGLTRIHPEKLWLREKS